MASAPEKTEIEFVGRVDGMGSVSDRGDYIRVSIYNPATTYWEDAYISLAMAELLGRELLRHT